MWIIERRTTDGTYKIGNTLNPTGSMKPPMVLLYGALTSHSSGANHYDAVIHKSYIVTEPEDVSELI